MMSQGIVKEELGRAEKEEDEEDEEAEEAEEAEEGVTKRKSSAEEETPHAAGKPDKVAEDDAGLGIGSNTITSSVAKRKIFDWVEEIVGSQFKEEIDHDEDDDDGKKKTATTTKAEPTNFSLLEFELGKDEPSEDDLLRRTLGEGMMIPLKVVYTLHGVRTSKQLVLRLPTYFFDSVEDVTNNNNESNNPDPPPPTVTVHTHETYFHSKVYPDIKNFLLEQDLSDLKLVVPECFYVKHAPKYEICRTPALIENLVDAKSLLLLADPKGEGFNELESIEDVDLQEGVAVMTEMAKLHAVTWALQEKTGRKLTDIWQDLLAFSDQDAINDSVLEASFQFIAMCYESAGAAGGANNVFGKLLDLKPKIERMLQETLYASGPAVPTSLLHMMIGGPNLFFRRKYTPKANEFEKDYTMECCIVNWSLATIGNPILDIALFMCVSLVKDARSRYTSTFLQHYWQTFESVAEQLNVAPSFNFKYIVGELEKFQVWSFLFMIAACKHEDMKLEEVRDILQNILDILPFDTEDDPNEDESAPDQENGSPILSSSESGQ